MQRPTIGKRAAGDQIRIVPRRCSSLDSIRTGHVRARHLLRRARPLVRVGDRGPDRLFDDHVLRVGPVRRCREGLGDGGGAFAATIAAVLLNARFGPMGLAIVPSLKGGSLPRALEGQAVVDASWALASRGGGRFDREFMLGATAPQLAAWVGGTVVGVLGGNFIGDAEKLGLELRYR
jgi:hypothetical protein